ncbi:NAD-dependent succinate-semialdehyde dehydrogenase [Inhella gelatinilytica]|uniref:NAD-dependent succinate-semialdehyde dehydrogenase n=1 Tax=Inhella gelatinilytica TaxID=2795030 RepID=A0A931IW07_9BURK|nr:NAD-dependent succinate-semialdehyde dehydrogenase [Inhella gelatinilytica]MBH9552596.1 NAD-dependent succinate-semialdehyde dehydrogenase [Inhella gelatinilytica]
MSTPAPLALLREAALLDGHWVQADDGQTFDVHDPATGQRLGHVPLMGAAETRRAIDAAARAWPAWRRRTARDRGHLLRQLGQLMLTRSDELATLITREQGKPLAEARSEVAYAAAYLDWYAEEGKRVYGETIPTPSADRRLLVFREPIGVCAAITPWNFPLAMMARKVAPALAAGNPIIVKPAESTPFTALALGLLTEEVGLPPGLLQVLTGEPRAIGAELCAHPTVRKLSFTGSTPVGRLLFAQSASTIKKLSLELGGLAPFIVFDDADLDAAVEGALASKYRNAGQTCVCSNRFFVQTGVYDEFADRLREASERLVVGNGLHSGVQQGPLINAVALAKVQHQVDDALARGARLLTGGKRHALGGNFYTPTVLVDVQPDMVIAREETFGPVAPLLRFTSEDEAIARSNDTEVGLAAYLYSRDIGRIFRVGEALEAGMVGVNTGLISTEVAPFGGVKQSGLGREGGRQGIDDYLTTKYMALAGL